jgi:hypothetical protein
MTHNALIYVSLYLPINLYIVQSFYSERNLRGSAFMSGGYVERSLRLKGVSPYRSNSLFHVSDWLPTIMSVVSSSALGNMPAMASQQQSAFTSSSSSSSSDHTARALPHNNRISEEEKEGGETNYDLHLYEGVDQWTYLMQAGEASSQLPSPRKAVLHGKTEYNVRELLFFLISSD